MAARSFLTLVHVQTAWSVDVWESGMFDAALEPGFQLRLKRSQSVFD
jgi:hypothetical protein